MNDSSHLLFLETQLTGLSSNAKTKFTYSKHSYPSTNYLPSELIPSPDIIQTSSHQLPKHLVRSFTHLSRGILKQRLKSKRGGLALIFIQELDRRSDKKWGTSRCLRCRVWARGLSGFLNRQNNLGKCPCMTQSIKWRAKVTSSQMSRFLFESFPGLPRNDVIGIHYKLPVILNTFNRQSDEA